MGQGEVDQVQPENIGLWIHRMGRSSHERHGKVAWVEAAENCGILWQHSRA